ncbi:MAG TPA: transposase, partial [Nannocystaceae bacterium]|nr:transposase [Nannocystaceae bacterium]
MVVVAAVGRSPALAVMAHRAQEPAPRPSLTLSAFGMHLHAATTVDGRDRKQLERVCRYLLRPPFAHDAVKALPDGRVRVLFNAPWRSGVAHADMTPDKFLARL